MSILRMEFFEKQFDNSRGFVLVPTAIHELSRLIRERINLKNPFVIYHGTDIGDLDPNPIVGHSGTDKGELLAPVLSLCDETNEDGVYMLDPDQNKPKIIYVPTGIQLVGSRDAYRFICSMQQFYTWQSVEQLLGGLRCNGWVDYTYTKQNTGPIAFTPITTLLRDIRKKETT